MMPHFKIHIIKTEKKINATNREIRLPKNTAYIIDKYKKRVLFCDKSIVAEEIPQSLKVIGWDYETNIVYSETLYNLSRHEYNAILAFFYMQKKYPIDRKYFVDGKMLMEPPKLYHKVHGKHVESKCEFGTGLTYITKGIPYKVY